MAQRGFDDEELTISLSSSQLRRNTASPDGGAPPPPPPPSLTVSVMSATPTAADGVEIPMSATAAPARESKKTEQRIDQYKVLRTLGEGSFGKVKLAVHIGTGQQVALKIISRKRLISRDMAGRVEREIEYLQLLRHPHIIKLYSVIKTMTEIIMVLEYAGGELFDYIVQNGRMREAEARRFFQQMICAVEYCHRHKIVHRDLKPENLLLDDNLNVKIADFGLSNIMTDGNFLKTSCGSPNYAAPEVIGGKLYAGQEVDVWSCGVILYVLIVGRLPFDDDHIPSLFAKIARGTYSVPPWMQPDAIALIKKMLVVNPVHRATIEDVRDDPWFNKDLPAYLAPPVEEFMNTGVDLSRAIKKSDIAPNASAKVQERLHNEVTDKISKTMGYGKKDVEEALMAEEPSAIKDAYMIVRENKLTDLIKVSDALSPGSDPATASPMPSTPSTSAKSTTQSGLLPPRPYGSQIGVLPSSLPTYHKDYMEREKAGLNPVEDDDLPPPLLNDEDPAQGQARTEAEKEELARRLRPHSRSQLRLSEAGRQPAEPGAAAAETPTKKVKPVRWQFGIRSRNAPWEALLCIHKALQKLGATYLPDENYEKVHGRADDPAPNSAEGSFLEDYEGTPLERDVENGYDGGDGPAGSTDPLQRYKLPADPWHIRVRWQTHALRRTTTLPPQQEMVMNPNLYPVCLPGTDRGEPQKDILAVHMDIQIYEMEQAVYLVDFKCSGYETADRRLLEEKEVSSPFPFLDMAAKLIMQLAEAD